MADSDHRAMVRDAERVADAIESTMQWQSSLTRTRRRRLERIPFPEGFVISDPWRPDNPLVWCSPDFYRLTGYSAAEILGRNCRFLQGEETDQQEIDKMRDGIKAVRTVTACFLNYVSPCTCFRMHSPYCTPSRWPGSMHAQRCILFVSPLTVCHILCASPFTARHILCASPLTARAVGSGP
jgi:hypothetical protein